MSKFTYKGVNLQDIVVNGPSSVTNFTTINYKPASAYSTERPLPFNFTQNGTDISMLMDASFIDLTTGTGTIVLSPSINSVRAVLEGGGGGGGGCGGCGVGGGPVPNPRQSGNNGMNGAAGGIVYLSDTSIANNRTITYTVGSAGGLGGNGPNKGNTDDTTRQYGDDGIAGGAGQVTTITLLGTTTITANAGTGGDGGQGGPSGANAVTPAVTNYTNPAAVTYQQNGNSATTVIPPEINPLSYKNAYANYGNGTPSGPGSGTAGDPGFIRIYLLKD